jgi:ABC-type transporter Mla maintaining outer membrane lipid asymmetry ATPase subunit MlaF
MFPPERPRLTETTAPVVEMVDVTIRASDSSETALVEGVHWTIGPSDYWVVAGLPGAGKSDLLATAAGLNRPLRGTLRLFGRDTAGLAEEEWLEARLRVGLVFENGGRLFNHLTIAGNIALPICYHGNCSPEEAKARVDQILHLTGLTAMANRTPGRIKPPWRQRAALARALATGPSVLLLDNPLAGLGLQEARWWRQLLSELTAGSEVTGGRPLAVAVACSDLRPWADHGKRFALLKQKRWCPIGGRTELARCADPLLHELLAAGFNAG